MMPLPGHELRNLQMQKPIRASYNKCSGGMPTSSWACPRATAFMPTRTWVCHPALFQAEDLPHLIQRVCSIRLRALLQQSYQLRLLTDQGDLPLEIVDFRQEKLLAIRRAEDEVFLA